jgi:hypothetical protein
MSSSARPLKDFAAHRASLDLAEFEKAEGAGFLLFTPTQEMNQADGDFSETVLAEESSPYQPSNPGLFDVYPIVKKDEAPGNIIVGRDSTCDVTIVHPSISSVHAFFTLEDDGVFRVYDGGSRNGTFVNAIDAPALKDGVAGLPVAPMARIKLGAFEATFLDAGRLYAMVGQLP